MTQKTKAVIVGLALAGTAAAQWVSVVTNPIEQAQLAIANSKLIQQVLTEAKLLIGIEQNVKRIEANAIYYSNKNTWLAQGQMMLSTNVANQVGETATWGGAVNGAGSAQVAWKNATVVLHANPFLAINPPESAQVAAVETIDGAATNAIQVLGQSRTIQPRINAAITSLERSTMSGAAKDNSEVQVLNTVSAGQMQQLRMQQGQAAVLGSILETQITQAKTQRDALAAHLNTIQTQEKYAATDPGFGHIAHSLAGYEDR